MTKLSSKVAVSFVSPLATDESFCCYTSLTAFGIIRVPGFGHSDRYILLIVSYCFHFHFPYDIWCKASFPILICYLCIFFGGLSVRSLAHFEIRLFIFFLLSFKQLLFSACQLSPAGTWYLLMKILFILYSCQKQSSNIFTNLLKIIQLAKTGMKLWFVHLQSMDSEMIISPLLTDT